VNDMRFVFPEWGAAEALARIQDRVSDGRQLMLNDGRDDDAVLFANSLEHPNYRYQVEARTGDETV
jgi:hypothetical protein